MKNKILVIILLTTIIIIGTIAIYTSDIINYIPSLLLIITITSISIVGIVIVVRKIKEHRKKIYM